MTPTSVRVEWHEGAAALVNRQGRRHRAGSRRAPRGRTDRPIGLALRPWSSEELTRATHAHEPRPDGRTHITLALATHGVGCASCGPGVLPAHRLTPNRSRCGRCSRDASVSGRPWRRAFDLPAPGVGRRAGRDTVWGHCR
ncbi:MAG TPA: hypothetical protein DD420_33635 [Streptomyces sp.]|nr:hypothetical protein [Streptomyces sp.]